AELNARALTRLEMDKRNEARCLMDGAWTGDPYKNQLARRHYPRPHTIPAPTPIGRLTAAGTRAAARAVIRYRATSLRGKGASLLDGYMEDLATDRIYRLMIAQRMLHQDAVAITDEAGRTVRHTPEFVSALFDEELRKILSETPSD